MIQCKRLKKVSSILVYQNVCIQRKTKKLTIKTLFACSKVQLIHTKTLLDGLKKVVHQGSSVYSNLTIDTRLPNADYFYVEKD